MNVDPLRALPLAITLLCSALGLPVEASSPPPLRVTSLGPTSSFDRELLSIFAKLGGRQVLFTDERSVSPATPSGRQADLMTGILVDAPLPSEFVATREVIPARLVAVTRLPAAWVESIEALRWKRLGVIRGSRAEKVVAAAKVSGAELVQHSSLHEAAGALRSGALPALLLELPMALSARLQDRELQLGAFLGPRGSVVYAVRRNDVSLLRQLNAFLLDIRGTGSWSAAVNRHFGAHAFETLGRAHLLE